MTISPSQPPAAPTAAATQYMAPTEGDARAAAAGVMRSATVSTVPTDRAAATTAATMSKFTTRSKTATR